VNAGASAGAQDDPPPWTGPWADDARRLFQLFQAAVEQAGAASAAAAEDSGAAGAAEPGGYEHPPECRYCPFCQGVTLLRRAGPEVLDQLSEFAAGLAATLRATQPESGAAPGEPSAEPGDGSADEPPDGPAKGWTSAPARPPSTVRIDVTD
jgi:hypothetical protein